MGTNKGGIPMTDAELQQLYFEHNHDRDNLCLCSVCAEWRERVKEMSEGRPV
jgi:hypothetical protein